VLVGRLPHELLQLRVLLLEAAPLFLELGYLREDDRVLHFQLPHSASLAVGAAPLCAEEAAAQHVGHHHAQQLGVLEAVGCGPETLDLGLQALDFGLEDSVLGLQLLQPLPFLLSLWPLLGLRGPALLVLAALQTGQVEGLESLPKSLELAGQCEGLVLSELHVPEHLCCLPFELGEQRVELLD
jgi:hypothetical protein